jgi:phospholipase C
MAQQMIGLSEVPLSPTAAPWSQYSPAAAGVMTGYVTNYSQLGGDINLMFASQKVPPAQNLADVMNCFTPAQLPVTSFLARNYGVCDRSFVLCAAPGVTGGASFIDDLQYFDFGQLVPIEELPSILSQLDGVLGATGAPGPFWKVYFHDYSIAFDTVPYVQAKATSSSNINVSTFDLSDWPSQVPKQFGSGATAPTFVDDLLNGTLPPFSFIEPRYFDNYAPTKLAANSNHPGSAWTLLGNLTGTSAPIDAATGEVFLMQLYNMLRASPLWDDMLLIVAYDEPGGIWDHVPPPFATPPGTAVPPAQFDDDPAADGFGYNVFGGRVPAIIVSPQIAAGSVVRAAVPFDHTAIIRTVRDAFLAPRGVTAPLNDRDRAAPSVLTSLTATEPNPTGFFDGQIVAGPQSLYFDYSLDILPPGPQTIFASAGPSYPLGVTASALDGQWLSISVTGPPTALAVTVTVDGFLLEKDQTFSGAVQIFSIGATAASNSPVTIPVQFLRTSSRSRAALTAGRAESLGDVLRPHLHRPGHAVVVECEGAADRRQPREPGWAGHTLHDLPHEIGERSGG